jgi:hypothetical protein
MIIFSFGFVIVDLFSVAGGFLTVFPKKSFLRKPCNQFKNLSVYLSLSTSSSA